MLVFPSTYYFYFFNFDVQGVAKAKNGLSSGQVAAAVILPILAVFVIMAVAYRYWQQEHEQLPTSMASNDGVEGRPSDVGMDLIYSNAYALPVSNDDMNRTNFGGTNVYATGQPAAASTPSSSLPVSLAVSRQQPRSDPSNPSPLYSEASTPGSDSPSTSIGLRLSNPLRGLSKPMSPKGGEDGDCNSLHNGGINPLAVSR